MATFRLQKSRNDSHSVVEWPPKPAPSSVVPAGNDAGEERVQRFAADPCLDAEPAARDDRAHQRRQVRTDRSVGGAREDRERNAVPRARMRVEQDRDEHDGVAERDREERLPPAHARGHQSRRQHVGRDAVRHADPQRRVVVGRPVAPRDRDRREVFVVERRFARRADVSSELDAAVRHARSALLSLVTRLSSASGHADDPRKSPAGQTRRTCATPHQGAAQATRSLCSCSHLFHVAPCVSLLPCAPCQQKDSRTLRHRERTSSASCWQLPNYTVFDFLAFRVEPGGTVRLLGQVVRPTLKSDAERRLKGIEGIDQVINDIEVLPVITRRRRHPTCGGTEHLSQRRARPLRLPGASRPSTSS